MMVIIIITIIHYSPCCCLYLFIARHFFTATSLKCYKCNSETSWHQCEKNRETVTCPEEHEEVCSKVLYDHELHSRQTYTKFCDMKSQCTNTTQPICKAAETHNAQCEVHCCTHDLCNAGSATAVSGILQIACAVLLLVFLSVGRLSTHEDIRIGQLMEARFENYYNSQELFTFFWSRG